MKTKKMWMTSAMWAVVKKHPNFDAVMGEKGLTEEDIEIIDSPVGVHAMGPMSRFPGKDAYKPGFLQKKAP